MREEGVWFTPEELATVRNRVAAIFVAVFGLPAVVVAAVFGAIVGVAVTAVVVAVGGALWWYNRAFERTAALRFTDDAIQYRRGVWFRQQSDVPYRRITNVTTSQGPLERWVDAGGISVQTAGQSGQTGAELSVTGLPDYEELKQQLMSKVRATSGVDAADVPADQRERDTPADDELLAEVRRIRELLE